MTDAPERIWISDDDCILVGLEKSYDACWVSSEYCRACVEYIRKDIATKAIKDRIKRILFKLWQRVESGQFDSSSFVGDTALSLRDSLYPPSENELEQFWQEYETWKTTNKALGEK